MNQRCSIDQTVTAGAAGLTSMLVEAVGRAADIARIAGDTVDHMVVANSPAGMVWSSLGTVGNNLAEVAFVDHNHVGRRSLDNSLAEDTLARTLAGNLAIHIAAGILVAGVYENQRRRHQQQRERPQRPQVLDRLALRSSRRRERSAEELTRPWMVLAAVGRQSLHWTGRP